MVTLLKINSFFFSCKYTQLLLLKSSGYAALFFFFTASRVLLILQSTMHYSVFLLNSYFLQPDKV